MKCGLLGHPLGHSYSPMIHSYLGSYAYSLFDVSPQELDGFLRNADFTGINVTLPYKKSVLPYCRELSDVAGKMGAVNTIVRRMDGTLIGHNTDYFGFQFMLKMSGIQVSDRKVLVLGSGGASNTVCNVLKEQGANVIVISRTGENHYGNLHLHADAAMIVNTTPVGMYPHTLASPLDLGVFPNLEGVLDVVYNPSRTKILLDAQQRGLTTMNGLMMLVAQAKESSQWFTGSQIPDQTILEIHKRLKSQMENTVLIGMPGCGKSTVGALLAEKSGKKFVDLDDAIAQKTGIPVPQIIAQSGETVFRQLENEVICQYGKESGLVIATGGGCVTREDNYLPLHQNGTIYWLQRDIDLLPTEGRPLSEPGKLEAMYNMRKPMYARFSDHTVSNTGSIESVVEKIMQLEAET